jgi:hypothetical protein
MNILTPEMGAVKIPTSKNKIAIFLKMAHTIMIEFQSFMATVSLNTLNKTTLMGFCRKITMHTRCQNIECTFSQKCSQTLI